MTLSSLALTGAIGAAGALGALARYLLGRYIAERANTAFPWGTFTINLSGAFLIGLIFALASQNILSSWVQIVLATGFLGGYTTFSTMSWEGLQLARGGSTRQSILYLAGSTALGLLMAALGLGLGWLL
jgi:CrcB protein